MVGGLVKPRPQARNRKLPYSTLQLTLSLNKLEMASTDQPPLDPTEKDTWEKLTLWDRRVDALAPLTEKQMDSVLELRAAAEILSVPSEVRSGSAASQWASRIVLTCSLGVSVRLLGEKKSSLYILVMPKDAWHLLCSYKTPVTATPRRV